MTDPKDSYAIKLSGAAELPSPLKIGHNIHCVLEGSIVSETISDDESGGKTHFFKFKPVIVETINEKGERLRAKDTRSLSTRIRSRSYVWWKEHLDRGMTQEEMYEWYGERTLYHYDEVVEFLEKLDGKMGK